MNVVLFTGMSLSVLHLLMLSNFFKASIYIYDVHLTE